MPRDIQEHLIQLACACVHSFNVKSNFYLTLQNKNQEVNVTSLAVTIIFWQNDTNL